MLMHTAKTLAATALYQECALMLGFFEEVKGCVRCTFLRLQSIQRADTEKLISSNDNNFSSNASISYSSLVGLGSDGPNVMLGSYNSVTKGQQPGLIFFHCNCHIAALIANHASKASPDFLEDVTIPKSPKRY